MFNSPILDKNDKNVKQTVLLWQSSSPKVFNVTLKFRVSKDKSEWVVDQTELIKIPYVISLNESYKFKENIKVAKRERDVVTILETTVPKPSIFKKPPS